MDKFTDCEIKVKGNRIRLDVHILSLLATSFRIAIHQPPRASVRFSGPTVD